MQLDGDLRGKTMEDSKPSAEEVAEDTGHDRIQYSLDEAKAALTDLSLVSMQFGDYLVILKDKFDMIIAGEPYHALTLLLDVGSGAYLARIWSKTVYKGRASSVAELNEVCSYHFQDERLCLGLFQDESEQAGLDFLSSQTPVPRRISKTCLGVIGEEADSEDNACSECRKPELSMSSL